MILSQDKTLYTKIAERICDEILSGRLHENDKVPSVRELAGEYEVNTNTVLRAFDILQREEIIYQKRGIGAYVSEGSKSKIRHQQKMDFKHYDLPEFLRKLDLLGLEIGDVVKAWDEYKREK